jgi:hypothetical protein
MTKARPYRSNKHLHALIETDAGSFTVLPLRTDDIHFDVAWSGYFPAREGQRGSTALDIGRGVKARGIGNARLIDGVWRVKPDLTCSKESAGDLTLSMRQRFTELLERLINEWASTHAGDIAQADDIDRSNGARTLEENIARHEQALTVLRAQLAACEAGEPFTRYPDLPTKGR